MLSAQNLPHVAVVRAAEVDVYALLYFRTLIATKAGFEALTARMKVKKTVEEGA
jgi:ribosomal protein L4